MSLLDPSASGSPYSSEVRKKWGENGFSDLNGNTVPDLNTARISAII